MHFLNWVLDQQGDDGEVGLFARSVYQDINNGCGLRFTEPMEWQDHFNQKHKRTARAFNELLLKSFVAYAGRFSADKE